MTGPIRELLDALRVVMPPLRSEDHYVRLPRLDDAPGSGAALDDCLALVVVLERSYVYILSDDDLARPVDELVTDIEKLVRQCRQRLSAGLAP